MPDVMPPLVAIIILNWNGGNDTVECLESLRKLVYPRVCLIVVDNASEDDSVGRIRRNYSDVVLICNPKNLGYAEGNNIGIKHALRIGAEFVLLLNNDTVVDKNFLQLLVGAVKKKLHVGLAGPKILSHGSPNRIWFAGPKKTWAFGRPLELGHRGFGEVDSGQYDRTMPVGFITGCSLLISREVISRVGLLDSDYFAYYEDADYCLRAKNAGYALLYVPKARIWHKAARSTTDIYSYSPVTMYLGIRNRLLFMKKHGNPVGWLIFIPYFVGVILRSLFKFPIFGRGSVTRPIYFGIKDFILSNYGPGSLDVLRKVCSSRS